MRRSPLALAGLVSAALLAFAAAPARAPAAPRVEAGPVAVEVAGPEGLPPLPGDVVDLEPMVILVPPAPGEPSLRALLAPVPLDGALDAPTAALAAGALAGLLAWVRRRPGA